MQPISVYDKEGLQKAFDKIPNPEKSFVWKMIRLVDYLLGHKRWFVRWLGVVVSLLLMPFFLICNKINYGSFIPK